MEGAFGPFFIFVIIRKISYGNVRNILTPTSRKLSTPMEVVSPMSLIGVGLMLCAMGAIVVYFDHIRPRLNARRKDQCPPTECEAEET